MSIGMQLTYSHIFQLTKFCKPSGCIFTKWYDTIWYQGGTVIRKQPRGCFELCLGLYVLRLFWQKAILTGNLYKRQTFMTTY